MQTMTSNEISRSTGKDKVQQYGWGVKDSPGDLVWIGKNELFVDHSYQRNAAHPRVLKIAQKWSWLACGVIVVAKREAESGFYVVDGQHRALAAQMRSDIERLPCLVFKTDGAKEEAAGFYDANTGRRLPTSHEKWKAQLMRGDPTTILVDAAIRQAGRVPGQSTGPEYVRCLTSLLTAAQADRDRFARIWPLVVEVCQGQPLHERVFDGLVWIEANLPKGESLTDRRWRERVTRVGFNGLLDAAQRAATFYAYGGSKVWGLGMLEALNKGCRIHIALAEKSDRK